jgi:murein DD-endopeptidase MepM/ murein hydrolase activator NlpD
LLDKGVVHDTRRLTAPEILKAAAAGPRIAAYAQIIPSQFCNGRLLDGVGLAKSDTLAPGEAIVFSSIPMVWAGKRDALRISTASQSASLAIKSDASQTKALWPIEGTSYAAVGPTFSGHHRWLAFEEFAYDIGRVGNGKSHSGDGTKPSDYFIYGQPVRAVAAGKAVRVADGRPDSVDQFQRPGEADEAYLERISEAQSALIVQGIGAVLGNHVVIDHGNGEFSVYAHLKPGSIRVQLNDALSAGQVFAQVGTSGNSTEPHLHFQLSDCADVQSCRSIPISFDGIRLPFYQGVSEVQSGDIVETMK